MPQPKVPPRPPALPRDAPADYQVQDLPLFGGALSTPTRLVREPGSERDELASIRAAAQAIDAGRVTTYCVQILERRGQHWRLVQETIPVRQRAVARAEWRRLVDFDTDSRRAVFVERTAHNATVERTAHNGKSEEQETER